MEPQFNKEMPQNAWDFFDPSYDDNFEKEHPVIFGILCVIGILVLVFLNILFTIYITLVTPPEGDIWNSIYYYSSKTFWSWTRMV